MRYVPDGSLCTASVEQIFPRDGVHRNCFELASYHDCISNRIGSGIRTALPTLSVPDRAIIVLNHHRFWEYASGPSSSGNTLPSSIHDHVARRSALPRERFSPMAQNGRANVARRCRLSGYERTWLRRGLRSIYDPPALPAVWPWEGLACLGASARNGSQDAADAPAIRSRDA